MTMRCPVCQQPMEQLGQDTSSNPDTGAQYQRMRFVCKTDDVWVKAEVPSPAQEDK